MSKRIAVFSMVAGAVLASAALVGADPGGIPAEPTQAKAVGKGLKLWVTVDYAKGGDPGKPPGGSSDICTDADQSGFANPFAKAKLSGLALSVNAGSAPSGVDALSAVSAAASAWNAVEAGYFSVAGGGTKTAPAQDGVNAVGWARLVPRNVLAATWTWTDSSGRVVEADVFYNSSQRWATLSACGGSAYDVQAVGAHELGHAVALSHYSDAQKQATMYPSAPAGEIRKRTLTSGDAAAFVQSLS